MLRSQTATRLARFDTPSVQGTPTLALRPSGSRPSLSGRGGAASIGSDTSPGGVTGRRGGFKVPLSVEGVWVRVPPRALPETYTETPFLTERFDRALDLAHDHHRRQLRKGTEIPYVSHLLAVASLTLEMGGSEDEAIAALLHDLVEDGGGQEGLARIERDFGADVARIVLANSDADTEPKPPWKQRKDEYLQAIAHKAPDELRVSLADKLHNARAILLDYRTHGERLWDRFKSGSGRPVRWYYRELAKAFEARRGDIGPRGAPMLDELRRTVDELDRLADASARAEP